MAVPSERRPRYMPAEMGSTPSGDQSGERRLAICYTHMGSTERKKEKENKEEEKTR